MLAVSLTVHLIQVGIGAGLTTGFGLLAYVMRYKPEGE